MAPLGTKGVIYVTVKVRDTTYSDHGKEGWYVGPVWNKYRNYKIYIPSTNGVRESNAVQFFPTKCRIPNNTANERIIAAIEDLSYELKQLYDSDENNLIQHGTPLNQAIKSLKLNIGTQLDEAAEILRESKNTTEDDDDKTVKTANTRESVTNDIFSKLSSIPSTIESRRVNTNQAASRRVKEKENAKTEENKAPSRRGPEEKEEASPQRVSVNEARSRYKVGTVISKYFDGIAYKGTIIKPYDSCLLYTSPSPRDATLSRMPSSA